MTRVLVLLSARDLAAQLGSVTAAAEIVGNDAAPTAIVAGRAPSDADAAAVQARGAGDVVLLAHPSLTEPPQADHLLALFGDFLSRSCDAPVLILMPADAVSEEICARLAARLDGVPLGRCDRLEIEGAEIRGHRAAYGGRVETVVTCRGTNVFATLRGSEHRPPARAPGAVRRVIHDSELPAADPVTLVPSSGTEARLDGAQIVVSGGRGMEGPEGFRLLRDVATEIGGAVGGSLPTVDAGWMPVSRQIGQSGRFVAPGTYLAVAISGTPQHMAGIAQSSRIIAINRDPDAEIFRHAVAGAVADWRDLLPRLLLRLRAQNKRS